MVAEISRHLTSLKSFVVLTPFKIISFWACACRLAVCITANDRLIFKGRKIEGYLETSLILSQNIDINSTCKKEVVEMSV